MLLEVEGLKTHFFTPDGVVKAVDGVSFVLEEGKTLGIVGESGSGKSVTALSLLRLLQPGARTVSGRVCFQGEDLLTLSETAMRGIRGGKIALIFQDPSTYLNPVYSVGSQVAEAVRSHRPDLSRALAMTRALDLLRVVGISDPEAGYYHSYPHQLSGGMKQRVMIAMALSSEPRILIADEPTASLDVTIQAQILRLILGFQRERGMSIVLITHDLGIVSGFVDDVMVMQKGRSVELAATRKLFSCPEHAYTQQLLLSVPSVRSASRPPIQTRPLVALTEGVKRFRVAGRTMGKKCEVHAVQAVSLSIGKGETLGLVGESGSGKSTLGHCLLRLMDLTSGSVFFDGKDLTGLSAREMLPYRRRMQIIFQDPFSSLNPRMTVGDIIEEPLVIHRLSGTANGRRSRVNELLGLVGLPEAVVSRYPHEFSGGQRQRIAIARALAVEPEFIVCDEPVSALDVTTQAQIVNLLISLQNKLGLTYLFISHDLRIVRRFCHRIAVMYLGKIVECADCETLYRAPKHPYTRALLSAVPEIEEGHAQEPIILAGEPPRATDLPRGCQFHPRCYLAEARCRIEIPKLLPVKGEKEQCVSCLLVV